MKTYSVCKLAHSIENNNPRNSEGAFIKLQDGRLGFFYSRYCGESNHDHANADLAAVYSVDNGETWSEPEILFKGPADGNLMSVSMLRLHDNRIMLLYIKKQILADGETVLGRPHVRFSDDECKTWSDEKLILDKHGYFVINNDRLVQLENGRIIVPMAFHNYVNYCGIFFALYSDDNGESWQLSDWVLPPATEKHPKEAIQGLLEPGIVKIEHGLMAWFRTPYESQYKSFSCDNGKTWSAAVRATEFPSQQSPLSLKYNPYSQKYIAVWNDLSEERWGSEEKHLWKNNRCRLVIAVSKDCAEWVDHTVIEYDIECGYCYTAMYFAEDGGILLAYCCGGYGKSCLIDTMIRKVYL